MKLNMLAKFTEMDNLLITQLHIKKYKLGNEGNLIR